MPRSEIRSILECLQNSKEEHAAGKDSQRKCAGQGGVMGACGLGGLGTTSALRVREQHGLT